MHSASSSLPFQPVSCTWHTQWPGISWSEHKGSLIRQRFVRLSIECQRFSGEEFPELTNQDTRPCPQLPSTPAAGINITEKAIQVSMITDYDRFPYSTEVTDDEARLGFVLVETNNPRRELTIGRERVLAVLFRYFPPYRIVKLNVQGNKRRYQIQRYGSSDSKCEPVWSPVSSLTYGDPVEAIRRYMVIQEEIEAITSLSSTFCLCVPGPTEL